jgi:aryl sulfotransferase
MGDSAESLRSYKTAVADNSRWEGFVHRPGDIFVCTPAKCGTTWVQTIVAALLWPDGTIPGPVMEVCPWLDARFTPIGDLLARLNAQQHRRCIKTHTPADGIPWFETGRYIAVGRDGRDAFMSWLNHAAHMRTDVIASLDEQAAADGVAPFPAFDGDVHAYFSDWLAAGSLFFNIATWWERRQEPNLLLVHYNDLKADLEGEMRRIAEFLGIEIDEGVWPTLVHACTFEGMKARSVEIGTFDLFEGGADTFLHQGTNARWVDVLTEEELARYDQRVAQVLSEDAADWLENGSLRVGWRP